ncbi:hypothetical protein GCM10010515_62230 [Streptomyces fructofermentans]|uniref:Uncharacterized protein n=1 Tax=Streptomyces fructofermentans TaxID=152141 RepID=A0A918NQ28_9ACTN|nr:hypothetical protein GCM10010515_62230 [Streptomyces fructofermentans]
MPLDGWSWADGSGRVVPGAGGAGEAPGARGPEGCCRAGAPGEGAGRGPGGAREEGPTRKRHRAAGARRTGCRRPPPAGGGVQVWGSARRSGAHEDVVSVQPARTRRCLCRSERV